ncbi:hypothetical protein XaplCFBP3122_10165 [Xanthomonas arboricola pv. populi]|uniref:Uncharacterized protein n=1 Tax=Xanthomonas arboricola pv. populi TaxID=487823 RepID=A0A2S6Z501_9XANT|nr:hypothetical protein XaplCFBP3122_10165 [Xanthomonas arboricola pv. populi]
MSGGRTAGLGALQSCTSRRGDGSSAPRRSQQRTDALRCPGRLDAPLITRQATSLLRGADPSPARERQRVDQLCAGGGATGPGRVQPVFGAIAGAHSGAR